MPLHVNIAREYMQQPGKKNRKGLKAAFQAQNVAATALPTDNQLSQWLKNHRRSASADELPAGPPRQMEMERSLEEWPTEMPEDLEELYLVTDPPYKCDKHSVCIAFSSRGMINAMKRLAGKCGVLFMDAKQGCTQDNWGVITGALSVKDGLRNTSFAKVEGRKVQGTAYTSHAQPGLQALIEVEKTENIVQFLMTLQRLWAKHCPDKPPLETWVKEVHTDFHPALEAARKILMGEARPCKDFFHLMQKQPTLEKKLCVVSSQPGQHVKENKGWLLFSLHIQRHLPTLDLSSAIYTGFLQRLRAKGEHDICSYLGPGGHAPYCVQATVRELRTVYGVSASNPNEDAQLLFSLHWTGLWGALPGADCGDQPLEAFHSPWEAQLKAMGNKPHFTLALNTMQTMFHTWGSQLQWKSSQPLLLVPAAVDVKLWNGPLLRSLGRTPAFDFADAAQTRRVHLLIEVSPGLHLVVMQRVLQGTFDDTKATMAARMLCTHGQDLHKLLRSAGILVDMKGVDGTAIPSCAQMSLVKEFFVDLVFVVLREDGHPPAPFFPGPLCTCVPFCRYAGCEHVEYVKCVDFPLRKATSTADSLPVQQRRGRKRGPTTARAKAKAVKPKGKAGRKDNQTKMMRFVTAPAPS